MLCCDEVIDEGNKEVDRNLKNQETTNILAFISPHISNGVTDDKHPLFQFSESRVIFFNNDVQDTFDMRVLDKDVIIIN